VNTQDPKRAEAGYSWKMDPLLWAYSALMSVPIVMVCTSYNFHRMDLCLYTGWTLLGFSIAIILLAGREFMMKGGAVKGESIVHTTVLVDSGVYAVIRHPQYLEFMLFVISLGLMSQHWLSIASGVLGSALFYLDVQREERMSVVKFGEYYERYMQRVPRMNFILGIFKVLRRDKKR
jgi:protein-S-isoprenylcysteine O-methyltransferase Ste14